MIRPKYIILYYRSDNQATHRDAGTGVLAEERGQGVVVLGQSRLVLVRRTIPALHGVRPRDDARSYDVHTAKPPRFNVNSPRAHKMALRLL